MQELSSSDKLWICVKDHIESKFGDATKGYWRLTTHDKAECDACTEYGGGVLMKCGNDKCKREYHVDCAYHKGGLSLELDGNLIYHCPTHFKPVLFCVCKERYDPFRAMICCDHCIEWYHCSCVGLQEEDAYQLEGYTCRSCDNLLKQNKPIPTSLIEKNTLKESLSSCHQTAIKAVGHLVELAGTISPLIDYFHSGMKAKYPLETVTEAIEFLSSEEFLSGDNNQDSQTNSASETSKDSNNTDNNANTSGDDENQVIERFGTENLVDSWRKQLMEYHMKCSQWFTQTDKLMNDCEIFLKYVILLDKTNSKYHEFSRLVSDSKLLESQAQDFCPSDVEFFLAFHESLLWIYEIFEIFERARSKSNLSPSDVSSELNTHNRSSNLRTRKLNSFQSKDPFCSVWLPIYQDYVKASYDFCINLNDWSKKTFNILNGKTSISLVDLETLINFAKEFPFQFDLYDDLITFQHNVIAYEKEIETYLNESSEITSKDYDMFTVKAQTMKVVGGTYEELTKAMEVYNILTDCVKADSFTRIPISTLIDLINRIEKLHNNLSTTISKLRQSLLNQVYEYSIKFKDDVKDVETVALVAREMLSKGLYHDNNILKSLQKYRAISHEETTIEYINKIDEIIPRIDNILTKRIFDESLSSSSSEIFYSPSDIKNLIQETEFILSQQLLTEYEIVHQSIEKLNNRYDTLLDVFNTCDRIWGTLKSTIDSIENGNAGTYEDFMELYNQAIQTGYIDQTILSSANNIKVLAIESTKYCNTVLQTKVIDIKMLGSIAEGLIHQSSYSPIENILHKKVKRYISICKTVISCYDILSLVKQNDRISSNIKNSDNSDSNNMEIISIDENMITESYLNTLKDLRHSIDILSIQALDPNESLLLSQISNDFMLYVWRVEIIYTMKHRGAYDDAIIIQQIGSKLVRESNTTTSTNIDLSRISEYNSLTLAINESMKYMEEVKTILFSFQELKQNINTILSNSLDSMDFTDHDMIDYSVALDIWYKNSDHIKSSLVELLNKETKLILSHPSLLLKIKFDMNTIETISFSARIIKEIRSVIKNGHKGTDIQSFITTTLPTITTATIMSDSAIVRTKCQVIDMWTLSNMLTSISNVLENSTDSNIITNMDSSSSGSISNNAIEKNTVSRNIDHRIGQNNILSSFVSSSSNSSTSSSIFLLASLFYKEIQSYTTQSQQWNDNSISLLPQKSTRLKTSSMIRQKTIEDLEGALAIPIARAVLTPMHERIYKILEEVDNYRKELIEIIMPHAKTSTSPSTIASIVSLESEKSSQSSEQFMGKEENNITTNVSNSLSESISDNLHKEITKLWSLIQKLELIPLDLIELRISKWVLSVYQWMQDTVYPPELSSDSDGNMDNSSNNSNNNNTNNTTTTNSTKDSSTKEVYRMSHAVAKQKLEDGLPIIAAIPKDMVENLVSMGILIINPTSDVSMGFHKSVHKILKYSGECYSYLESLVEATEDLSEKIMTSMQSKPPSKSILQGLADASNDLIVQIDPVLKRELEKMIQYLSSGQSFGQRSYGNKSYGQSLITQSMGQGQGQGVDFEDWSELDYLNSLKNRKRVREGLDNNSNNASNSSTLPISSTRMGSKDTFGSLYGTVGMSMKKVKPRTVCFKCGKDIRLGDMYCGDLCSIQSLSDYMKAILRYKKPLSLYSMLSTGSLDDKQKDIMIPRKDIDAYRITTIDKKLLMESLSNTIQKRGLTIDRIRILDNPTLSSLLNHPTSNSMNHMKPVGWTATESLKLKSILSSLSSELSIGAQSVIIKGTNDGIATNSNINNTTSAENSSPRSQAIGSKLSGSSFTFDTSSNSNMNSNQSNVLNDIDYRMSIRYGFEEIFISCLQKYHITGSYELGCIFAYELEEELYLKHCVGGGGSNSISNAINSGSNSNASNTSNGKDWNKREYKIQMLMIRRNLKQSHNEQLILDIVTYKSSIEKLLNMSSQDFADVSTKLKREQEHQNFLKESEYGRRSMQDEIEAHRRQAMTGQSEIWRQGDKTATSISTEKELHTENLSENAVSDVMDMDHDNMEMVMDNMTEDDMTEDDNINGSGSSNSSSAESSSGNTTKTLRRKGGYVDKGTRLITKKATKTANDEVIEMTEDEMNMALREHVSDSVEESESMDTDMDGNDGTNPHSSHHTKTTTKAPNVIDLLQASSKDKNNGGTNKSMLKDDIVLPVRLICDDGSNSFTISHPGMPHIECSAALTDRRVQGLLPSFITVEFRTKIAELEKFIIQSSASGRKIIATCRIFVSKGTGVDSTYEKLCKEFTDDRKAGLQNYKGNNVQFYIVPPQLKGSITILRTIEGSDINHTLYGIIVSREQGPLKYVNAEPSLIIDEDYVMPPSPIRNDESESMDTDDGNGLIVPQNMPMSMPMPISSVIGPRPGLVVSGISSASGIILPMTLNQPRPGLSLPVMNHIAPRPGPSMSYPTGMPLPPTIPRPPPSFNPSFLTSIPRPGVSGLQMGLGLGGLGLGQQQQQQSNLLSALQPNIQTGIPRPVSIGKSFAIPNNQGSGLSLPGSVATNTLTISFDTQPYQKQREIVRQIAQLCVDNGPETIALLKNKENSRLSTPFLFEGHPAFNEFHEILKQLLGRR